MTQRYLDTDARTRFTTVKQVENNVVHAAVGPTNAAKADLTSEIASDTVGVIITVTGYDVRMCYWDEAATAAKGIYLAIGMHKLDLEGLYMFGTLSFFGTNGSASSVEVIELKERTT